MKRPVLKWELVGIAIISSVGSLLHFAFEWSGQLPPIGVFAAVNESVFEHLKLTYWPALLYAAIEYRLVRESANNFLVAKAAGIYLMPAVIIAIFYVLPSLYVNRRLTRYYWDRTKRHKLSAFGLVFIIFLVAIALVGPFLTQDPTEVDFQEKTLPPVGFTIQQSVYDLKTEEFVIERINAHKDNLPCSPSDRWARPTTFAVKSPGVKTAKKVCATREDAEKWIAENPKGKSLFIEQRPGEDVVAGGPRRGQHHHRRPGDLASRVERTGRDEQRRADSVGGPSLAGPVK